MYASINQSINQPKHTRVWRSQRRGGDKQTVSHARVRSCVCIIPIRRRNRSKRANVYYHRSERIIFVLHRALSLSMYFESRVHVHALLVRMCILHMYIHVYICTASCRKRNFKARNRSMNHLPSISAQSLRKEILARDSHLLPPPRVYDDSVCVYDAIDERAVVFITYSRSFCCYIICRWFLETYRWRYR